MKINIQEVNNILTSLKHMTPVNNQKYVRRIWAITNHIALHSAKGKKEEAEIMTDLQKFINLLNEKYPISNDKSIGFDSYLTPTSQN